MPLTTYRDLDVWKRSMDLAEAVYSLTRRFPADERFGLTAQMRDASVSIPSNIAEGYGRTHRGDYLHHLSIARGSLMEVETHLTLAVRLKFISRQEGLPAWRLCQDVGKMLNRLIASLSRTPASSVRVKPGTRSPET
ncbi:MAG: four helix bundle protein [Planctomycetota bacterium]|nr:four helix bundle protein [Planctomycetota bacterium]